MKKFNILCLAAALAAPLLTGCSSGSDTPDEPTAPDTASYTITLVAKDGGMNSRAGLTPEAARENEGLIHDAILLLYDKSLNSTLTDADVVKYVYFGEVSGGAETLDIPITNMIFGTYYATVIVNVKDKSTTKSTDSEGNEIITDNYFNSDHWLKKKLSDIRDEAFAGAPYTNPLSEELSDYDHFVMVSDKEVKIDFSTDKPKIYECENGTASATTVNAITVERLSARVDLKIEGGVTEGTTTSTQDIDADGNIVTDDKGNPISVDTYHYHVPIYDWDKYNFDGTLTVTGDYLDISSVYLYNINQTSTYFIQRSSSTKSGTATYFGDENFGDRYAQAYVQCPRLTLATPLGWNQPATSIHTEWNGKIYDLFHADKNNNNKHKLDGNDDYYTVTYIGEYTKYDYDNGIYPYMTINYDYYDATDDGTGTYIYTNKGSYTYNAPILHCFPENGVIASDAITPYAVIRNTIYRYSLRFFADADYVYVRWYYYQNGTAKETYYTAAKFSSTILEGDGSNAS